MTIESSAPVTGEAVRGSAAEPGPGRIIVTTEIGDRLDPYGRGFIAARLRPYGQPRRLVERRP